MPAKIARFMGTTWGPPGSCRPQRGPMLAPGILYQGYLLCTKPAVYGPDILHLLCTFDHRAILLPTWIKNHKRHRHFGEKTSNFVFSSEPADDSISVKLVTKCGFRIYIRHRLFRVKSCPQTTYDIHSNSMTGLSPWQQLLPRFSA